MTCKIIITNLKIFNDTVIYDYVDIIKTIYTSIF